MLNNIMVWDYSKTRFRLSENLNNTPDKVKVKSLNGCDAIREKLDDKNTLAVKHQPVESVKPKTKMVIGLTSNNNYYFESVRIEQLWLSIKQAISLGSAIRMLFLLGVAM